MLAFPQQTFKGVGIRVHQNSPVHVERPPDGLAAAALDEARFLPGVLILVDVAVRYAQRVELAKCPLHVAALVRAVDGDGRRYKGFPLGASI